MSARLTSFVRENWALVSILLFALIFALWFASRLVLDFVYFNDPANVDVDLKPWMTPRFIVLTYDLPRPLVFETLGLDLETESGKRLRHVAEDMGLTLDELTALVRDRAATYRESGS